MLSHTTTTDHWLPDYLHCYNNNKQNKLNNINETKSLNNDIVMGFAHDDAMAADLAGRHENHQPV